MMVDADLEFADKTGIDSRGMIGFKQDRSIFAGRQENQISTGVSFGSRRRRVIG